MEGAHGRESIPSLQARNSETTAGVSLRLMSRGPGAVCDGGGGGGGAASIQAVLSQPMFFFFFKEAIIAGRWGSVIICETLLVFKRAIRVVARLDSLISFF